MSNSGPIPAGSGGIGLFPGHLQGLEGSRARAYRHASGGLGLIGLRTLPAGIDASTGQGLGNNTVTVELFLWRVKQRIFLQQGGSLC